MGLGRAAIGSSNSWIARHLRYGSDFDYATAASGSQLLSTERAKVMTGYPAIAASSTELDRLLRRTANGNRNVRSLHRLLLIVQPQQMFLEFLCECASRRPRFRSVFDRAADHGFNLECKLRVQLARLRALREVEDQQWLILRVVAREQMEHRGAE